MPRVQHTLGNHLGGRGGGGIDEYLMWGEIHVFSISILCFYKERLSTNYNAGAQLQTQFTVVPGQPLFE